MSDLRSAAEQALEALEMFENCDAFVPSLKKLSQDEEEHEEERRAAVYSLVGKVLPTLRAALEQPQRTLTDEVIADLWHANGGFHHHFARAVERWLKGEK